MSKQNEQPNPKMNESEPGTRYTAGGLRPDGQGPDVGIAGGSTGGEMTLNADAPEIDADDIDEGHAPKPVPGAEKQHHPAHAMIKGETKHLGI